MPKTFPSKIDSWLLVIIVFAMGAALVGIISALLKGGPDFWWAIVFPGVIGIALPLWVLTSTRYTLGDDDILIVRCGPFKWKIPVQEITNITPTSNPLSSPALSLDRLRIEYGNGRSLMVSPRDKERFIADVMARRH